MNSNKRLQRLLRTPSLRNVRKVKYLLDRDDKLINGKDSNLNTPLHLACVNAYAKCESFGESHKAHIELVNVLLSKGAKVNSLNIHGKTALHIASKINCEALVDLLLDHGAYIDLPDLSGFSPLLDASSNGCAEVVNLLLMRGANVISRGKTKHTPVTIACKHGQTSVLKVLLEHGEDVNKRTTSGFTPLHVACYSGNNSLQVIDLLLKKKANVELKTFYGDTALHIAVSRFYMHSSSQIYEKLLQNGALVDEENLKGETPYDLCFIYEFHFDQLIIVKSILEKHIVRLKTVGFNVDIYLDTDSDDLKHFKAQCVEELNKMKVTKINDLFSLDIVFKKLRNPCFLRSMDTLDKVVEKANSKDILEEFPLYGCIWTNTVFNALARHDLLEDIMVFFGSKNRKQTWLEKLPDLVKWEILYYLSNQELSNFLLMLERGDISEDNIPIRCYFKAF